jgi:Ca2+-binding RTX toxin-like protein
MTVTLAVGEGTLTATAGDSGATVGGSGTSSLTITGTIAQINSFLGAASSSTLTYAASSTPSPGTILTLIVNDNGNTGGGNLSSNDTAVINITASQNNAPVIRSDGGGATATESIYENFTRVTSVKATDSDGDSLTYAIVGGADDDKFTINATTGALALVAPPDYERPGDTGIDNVYDVVVEVSDGRGGTDTQAIAVRIVDTSLELVFGDNGDNTFFASGGIELFAGLRGNDTVSYAFAHSGVTASLGNSLSNRGEATFDLYFDIENLIGSRFDDKLTGNSGDNVLEGGAGNDVLIGGTNGAGGDTASYANATAGVTVKLATASAQNTVGAGTDTLSGFENVTGSAFGDTLTGTAGNNTLIGLAGADELNGGAGADKLIGGAGLDTLTGGSGADAFVFDFATEGLDIVRDFVSGTDFLQISAGGFGNGLRANAAVILTAAADYATASTPGTNGAFILDNAGADAGTVFWDANGGSGADAVALVKLQGVTSLLPFDFHVV